MPSARAPSRTPAHSFGSCSASQAYLVPVKYGSSRRPVSSVTRSSTPSSRSRSQMPVVRRSCQTIAGRGECRVRRSQTTAVSRWSVIPMQVGCCVGAGEGLAAGGDGRRPDVVGLVLDPAGAGEELRELAVAAGQDVALLAHDQRGHPGRSCVDGENRHEGRTRWSPARDDARRCPMIDPVTTGIELRPPGRPGRNGAPYAYAAVTEPGRMTLHRRRLPAGCRRPHVVAVGDVAGQARQVMANLVTALEGAGVRRSADVLKTTVYVATTDRADLVAAWDVVREALRATTTRPARCVGVTVLGYPDQLVEVEAVAVRDSWRSRPRRTTVDAP